MYANGLKPEHTLDHQKETASNPIAVVGGGIAGLGLTWRTSAKALFCDIFESATLVREPGGGHQAFPTEARRVGSGHSGKSRGACHRETEKRLSPAISRYPRYAPLSPAITNTGIAGHAIGLRPDLCWFAFIAAS